MTYELIGSPRIEYDYSDQWETTMVCDVRRNDGETEAYIDLAAVWMEVYPDEGKITVCARLAPMAR